MNDIIEEYSDFPTDKITDKVSINNFSLICVIGKGSYAEVILARKKDTGKIYALKILKKKKIEQKNQKNHVRTERNILVNPNSSFSKVQIDVNHPFIIKLAYTFQNEKKLYFALEYCPGGELFNLLQKKRQFSEEQYNLSYDLTSSARFYISQIILALEHLHKSDIIYRDLKPENVLIDEMGYIRLTDFGLSKRGIQGNKGATSVCGTPEYLAPEILFRTGHGKAVDWWTLGAILFEMLTGLPPFYTPNREELFEKIKFYTLKYPTTLSPNARNLLEGLFKKDPEKRLGGGPNDAVEIKEHAWFKGTDWDAILKKEVPAPFIPVLKGETDVSNFDPEFTEATVGSFDNNFFENGQNYPGWSYNGSESFKFNTKTSPPKSLDFNSNIKMEMEMEMENGGFSQL